MYFLYSLYISINYILKIIFILLIFHFKVLILLIFINIIYTFISKQFMIMLKVNGYFYTFKLVNYINYQIFTVVINT